MGTAETIDPEAIRSLMQEFTKAFGEEFITIGGWAVAAYGAKGKSLDGDAMISYQVEGILRDSYLVEKNPRMAKSQFICEAGCDIDIYVERQHRLKIPFDEVQAYSNELGGLRVPCPEHLLILKLEAYKGRRATPKGEKDQEDLLQLLDKAAFKNPEILEAYLSEEDQEMLVAITDNVALSQKVCTGNPVEAKTLRTNAKNKLNGLLKSNPKEIGTLRGLCRPGRPSSAQQPEM